MATKPLSRIHAQFLEACKGKLIEIGYLDNRGHVINSYHAEKEMAKSIFDCNNCSIHERGIRYAQPLWGSLWYENECACLFGDPNVGKSTLAFNIACQVAETGRKVLYYDLENMVHNYYHRGWSAWSCLDDITPDNLEIRHFAQQTTVEQMTNSNVILESIETDIYTMKAPVIVIDDIAQICPLRSCNKTHKVLRQLRQLLNRYHVSILVVAHASHHREGTPLALKHLTGDRQLAYAFDSIITLNEIPSTVNSIGGATHYVKQIKSRNTQLPNTELVTAIKLKLLYDEESQRAVIKRMKDNNKTQDHIDEYIDFIKDRPFLRFVLVQRNISETQLLYLPSNATKQQRDTYIRQTFAKGWSIRNIAEHTSSSKSTIHRLLQVIQSQPVETNAQTQSPESAQEQESQELKEEKSQETVPQSSQKEQSQNLGTQPPATAKKHEQQEKTPPHYS